MEDTLRAFLDASVLYPVSLRHLLMRLALESLFQAKWSATIHAEWINAVLRDHPHIPAARLHALRDAMDDRIDDAVVTGYEHLITTLTLPDQNDRHVLAAAIVGEADVIVTRNLRDFPDQELALHRMRAVHPDAFIRQLLDESPDLVLRVVQEQQLSLRNPPVPMDALLSLFERLDLSETVAELRRLIG